MMKMYTFNMVIYLFIYFKHYILFNICDEYIILSHTYRF